MTFQKFSIQACIPDDKYVQEVEFQMKNDTKLKEFFDKIASFKGVVEKKDAFSFAYIDKVRITHTIKFSKYKNYWEKLLKWVAI